MTDIQDVVDFTSIEFPTDRLTVKDLRRLYPHSFDLPSPSVTRPHPGGPVYDRNSLESTLGGLIDAERLLAGIAFKRAAGVPLSREETLEPQAVIAQELASSYIDSGLARGDYHADQLVRAIESQATAQVAGGRGR